MHTDGRTDMTSFSQFYERAYKLRHTSFKHVFSISSKAKNHIIYAVITCKNQSIS